MKKIILISSIYLASFLSAFGQIFVRTDVVGSAKVQVYQSSVVVDIQGSANEALMQARASREKVYQSIRELSASLANTRVVSITELSKKERSSKRKKKKENSSEFNETFNERTQATVFADVQIVPINETIVGNQLKTEIEIRVSSLPQYSDIKTFSSEVLKPNELFDNISMREGQVYLVSFLKPMIFDQDNQALYIFGYGRYSASAVHNREFVSLVLQRESTDLIQFNPGSFLAKYSQQFDVRSGFSYHFTFYREGEKFTLTLNENCMACKYAVVSDFLSSLKNGSPEHYFKEMIEIQPAFQPQARVLD